MLFDCPFYFKGNLLIGKSCFVYNILMIWRMSLGITKLVLLWTKWRMFSLPMILHDNWNRKDVSHVCPYHFVTLWPGFSEIALCREGYHTNCIFHVRILHIQWSCYFYTDMVRIDISLRIPCVHFLHMLWLFFSLFSFLFFYV